MRLPAVRCAPAPRSRPSNERFEQWHSVGVALLLLALPYHFFIRLLLCHQNTTFRLSGLRPEVVCIHVPKYCPPVPRGGPNKNPLIGFERWRLIGEVQLFIAAR